MKENVELTEILRRRNLKATSKRVNVLSVITEYNKAVPYSEIQNSLKDFDRVTLYRTLNTFIEYGIIHKALVNENETFYAMCSDCDVHHHHHKHVHFKCTKCDEVSCVQANHKMVLTIPGYVVESFEVEATGICQSCNERLIN
ncbi:MAG: Fur family transcriptional regulator [Crocinitomicaceae bacterium]|nr:Fur family transcriptional regulator [Crocinitomicaceae bacterium]|tara:strand:- start:6477 stop:6905 length:429 start_codon:yes stop_codon:yes gene_type:complete